VTISEFVKAVLSWVSSDQDVYITRESDRASPVKVSK